ncbi:hypothetical protein FGG78_44365 [Thioclava sp. BHET1]|nr:hypothetical protein FGG78_44365 [Thioclava sp. BHET1]
MRHDWIIDVLADLRHYAAQNDLPQLMQRVEEVIPLARQEIAAQAPPPEPDRYRRESGPQGR